MDTLPGKLSFIVMAAVVLAYLAARLVAWRYRRSLARMMMSVAPAGETAVPAATLPALAPPATITLAANRRAGWRLTALLAGLSLLMAASAGALQTGYAAGVALTPRRLAIVTCLQLWPLIPALAVTWRWPIGRTLAALAAWFGATVVILVLGSNGAQTPVEIAGGLLLLAGLPALLVSLLCLGSVARATAPWLMPLFVLLIGATLLGLDLLAWLVDRHVMALAELAGWISVPGVMLLFALAPWLVAWWPVRRCALALAAAYRARRLSELMVLFTAVWGLSLLLSAISALGSLGAGAALMLVPLALIPLAMTLWPRLRKPGDARPPTLLVLRVFQRDAATQRLFDDVIERWRLSGNTVLIAGTDLVERTLDADDVFAFIDGRLDERFVRSEAEVAARIAAFELRPDADGRHRINEVYCHDSTWKAALDALVQRSDLVLMDLRGFQARNAGTRHELGVLAAAARAGRVLLLADGATDRATAAAAIAAAPAGRVRWIDAGRPAAAVRREVRAALFAAEPVSPASAAVAGSGPRRTEPLPRS